MAKYIATKPCRISGKDYFMGDPVSAVAIDTESINRLVSMGYIAEAVDGTESRAERNADNSQNYAQPVENVEIPVLDGDTFAPLLVELSSLTDYFVGTQKSAADVVALVESETRVDLLTLIVHCDTRKTVKAAAEKRLVELAGDGE